MRKIQKNLSNLLQPHIFYPFSQSPLYSSTISNKFIVTRAKQQRYSLYLDNDITISQFLNKLSQLYPGSNIAITKTVDYVKEIGAKVDPQHQKVELEEMGDIPLTDALVLNKLVIYEKDQQNIMRLVYGVEISEMNMTNRINIPEHVEEGVVQLNNELAQRKVTVGEAFGFDTIRKQEDTNLVLKQGVEVKSKLSAEEQDAFERSIMSLIKIRKFNEQIGPYLPSSNKLMTRIITFLSINWVFLFYLTYAKYGWDVGEPVSYLTGLAVDLTAMMGLFEANSALISQREKDRKLIESLINLDAHQHMAKWRVAYLMRKLS